jgi:hypothetical protein
LFTISANTHWRLKGRKAVVQSRKRIIRGWKYGTQLPSIRQIRARQVNASLDEKLFLS